jgi:hypothetical protein
MHVDEAVRRFLCLEHIHKQLQNNGHWVYRNVWRQSAGYLVQQGCMQNMAKAQRTIAIPITSTGHWNWL